MWNFDYSNVSSIKELLSNYGFTPTKERGQNFLISGSARHKIEEAILNSLPSKSDIWEIGPGLGSITSLLLKSDNNVKCFELDYGFIAILKEAFKDEKNFTLIEGDALETVFKERKVPYVISGNLPYNVGTVLIAKLLENAVFPNRMVFTLQKEVAYRLCGKGNVKDSSSLTTLASLSYNSKILANLKPADFWPSPKVESSIVVMTKNDGYLYDSIKDNYADFVKINRAVFSMRRKTLKNNLSTILEDKTSQVLKEVNLVENLRCESLSVNDIVNITQAYAKLKQ